MHLLEEQVELDAAIKKLSELDRIVMDWADKSSIKPTDLVAAQALAQELRNLMGKNASEGTIRRCMRKMFE